MDTPQTSAPISLITERYSYGDVKRKTVNGKRHYEGEGKLLPSVTTIISATKAEKDKKGLQDGAIELAKRKQRRLKTKRRQSAQQCTNSLNAISKE